MSVGRIDLDLGLNYKQFNRELSGISNTATSKVGSAFKKLAVIVGGAFVVKKMFDFGAASVRTATDIAVSEAKLTTIMRQRMSATDGVIKSVKDLIYAQEALGVVDAAAQIAGSQELATYLEQTSSLKTLIPVMNDLVAQQYGLNASSEQVVGMATMIGKVMDGQVGALSRYGFTFDAAQENILKYGSEAQRAALLVDIVKDSLGDMNSELGKTPQGQWKQISFTFDSIRETVGNIIIQIRTYLYPYIRAVANYILKAAQYAQMLTNAIFGANNAVKTSAGVAAKAETDLGMAVKKAGKDIKGSLNSFDQLNVIAQDTADSMDDMSAGASAGVGDGLLSGLPTDVKLPDWIMNLADGIDFTPMIESFNNLKKALVPFNKALFAGLKWFWDDILVPFGEWTINNAVPAFLDVLTGAINVLTPAITAMMPVGSWLWYSFLQPLATFAGSSIVTTLQGLASALNTIGSWMSNNQSVVTAMTYAVVGFFAAWKGMELLAFIQISGGVAAAFASITAAIWAATGAKIVNAAETVYLTSLYAIDFVRSIAAAVVQLGLKAAAWVSVTAAMIANRIEMLAINAVIAAQFLMNWAKATAALIAQGAQWVVVTAAMVANRIAMVASTVAQGLLTAGMVAWRTATILGTVATTAFNVALAILTSPITLVVLGIAALVAGIVLLVKHWDTVKDVAASTWEGIKNVWSVAANWLDNTVIKPIANLYKGLFNGIIDGVNFVIRALNKIHFDLPGWIPGIGGKSFGISIPEVPKLAKGGMITGPTLAMVGDNKGASVDPEVVTPLSKLQDMLGASNQAVVEVLLMILDAIERLDLSFDIDGEKMARVMRPLLKAENGRIGKSAIMVGGVPIG